MRPCGHILYVLCILFQLINNTVTKIFSQYKNGTFAF